MLWLPEWSKPKMLADPSLFCCRKIVKHCCFEALSANLDDEEYSTMIECLWSAFPVKEISKELMTLLDQKSRNVCRFDNYFGALKLSCDYIYRHCTDENQNELITDIIRVSIAANCEFVVKYIEEYLELADHWNLSIPILSYMFDIVICEDFNLCCLIELVNYLKDHDIDLKTIFYSIDYLNLYCLSKIELVLAVATYFDVSICQIHDSMRKKLLDFGYSERIVQSLLVIGYSDHHFDPSDLEKARFNEHDKMVKYILDHMSNEEDCKSDTASEESIDVDHENSSDASCSTDESQSDEADSELSSDLWDTDDEDSDNFSDSYETGSSYTDSALDESEGGVGRVDYKHCLFHEDQILRILEDVLNKLRGDPNVQLLADKAADGVNLENEVIQMLDHVRIK
jgi:hypothetical protein